MRTIIGLLISIIWLSGVQSAEELVQSEAAAIKPGGSHTMTCRGSGGFTFGSYWMHWVRQLPNGQLQWLCYITSGGGTRYNDAVKGRVTATRDNNNNILSLKMDSVKTEDTAVYYCARVGYYAMDYWGGGTSLTVTSAEKRAPTVFPLVPCSESVSTSQYITFGCLSTNYLPPPVEVTWNSGSITSGIRNFPDVLGKSGTYLSSSLLTVSAEDYKNKKYTCNVNHKATGQTINKDVEVVGLEPKAPTVEVMQASCDISGSIKLVCLITGYFPKTISIDWLLNEKRTSINPQNSSPCIDSDGNFALRSQVNVPTSDWNAGDTYTCRANHPATSTKIEAKIAKCIDSSSGSHPKMTLLPPTPKELLITKQPKVSCDISKLDSTESLRITWTRSDGKRSLPFLSDPKRDFDGTWTVKSSLKITVADWNSKIVFTCKAQHSDLPLPMEKQIQKRDVESTDPIIYIYPPTKEELSNYDFINLNCLIKALSDKNAYVQWKKNGQVIDEEYYTNTEPVMDEETETYLMYSRLTIEKSDWLRESIFTCSGVLNNITSKDIKIEKCRGK